MIDKKSVKQAIELKDSMLSVGEGFYHSNPLTEVDIEGFNTLRYDIFDCLLAAGITGSSVLFTGHTDRGKTDLAKIAMTALFGEEDKHWHRLDVDLDFSKDSYLSTDFSALDGKTSDDLYDAQPFLRYPGLILDELNRAPPKIINKILHFLDKDIHLPDGTRLKTGYDDGNKRYQFIIAAINEGEEYKGAFALDKALRRRTLMEIPMDFFPTTGEDKLNITRNRRNALDVRDGEGSIDEVLSLYTSTKDIRLSPESEHFKIYLQNMSACHKSLTGTKEGIRFSEELCTKGSGASRGSCHAYALFEDNMCPMVTGMSEGVGINMDRLAAGFTLLGASKVVSEAAYYLRLDDMIKGRKVKEIGKRMRLTQERSRYEKRMQEDVGKLKGFELAQAFTEKYLLDLRIEPIDYISVFPFVNYSKIGLNKGWVDSNFQGSRYKALQAVAARSYESIKAFSEDNPDFRDLIYEKGISVDKIENLTENAKGNPWMAESLKPYMDRADPALKTIIDKESEDKVLDLLK